MNALVALAWREHVHHHAVSNWFQGNHENGWATSPVTESGFIRISSNPNVLAQAAIPEEAGEVLSKLREVEGHEFWEDSIAMCTHNLSSLQGYRQVTDLHLLLLARKHGGRLLTFDKRLKELDDEQGVTLLGI